MDAKRESVVGPVRNPAASRPQADLLPCSRYMVLACAGLSRRRCTILDWTAPYRAECAQAASHRQAWMPSPLLMIPTAR
jgi:hypothetical protein